MSTANNESHERAYKQCQNAHLEIFHVKGSWITTPGIFTGYPVTPFAFQMVPGNIRSSIHSNRQLAMHRPPLRLTSDYAAISDRHVGSHHEVCHDSYCPPQAWTTLNHTQPQDESPANPRQYSYVSGKLNIPSPVGIIPALNSQRFHPERLMTKPNKSS